MLDIISRILWLIATVVIVGTSIYFSFQLKFIQLQFWEIIKLLKKREQKGGNGLFRTLLFVLSGRAGVGSIAGIALGIYVGGIGSIFWMWVITLVAAIHAFMETVLGNMYKEKDEGDIYKGGPNYYIKKGLRNPKLSIIYTIVLFVCYICGFVGIQANTISVSTSNFFGIPHYWIAVLLTLFTAVVIFGGVKKIITVSSNLVPFMTATYVLFAVILLFQNLDMVPAYLSQILSSAFSSNAVLGGMFPALVVGIQRAIFASETGLGTGSILSSTGSTQSNLAQGYISVLGVYLTIFLICTSTAVIILCSTMPIITTSSINGIELVAAAFSQHFGMMGSIGLLFSVFLFSFSSILTGYYFGEASIKFLFRTTKWYQLLFVRILSLLVVFAGCLIPALLLWKIVDMFVAVLALINIYALYKLLPVVKKQIDLEKIVVK